MHSPGCPEFHFKGGITTWFDSLFIQLHLSIAWVEYQSFTKPACQHFCLLKAFNSWHFIKTQMFGFFLNRLLLWYFSLVIKEKALRFFGIFYASVGPLLLNALWTATFISQLGTGGVNRKIQRKNCRNLGLKGTMQSPGPSFAYIGLFPTVYQGTSTLNSHSWNEEEASDVNRRRCDPSRRNRCLTVIQDSQWPGSHLITAGLLHPEMDRLSQPICSQSPLPSGEAQGC